MELMVAALQRVPWRDFSDTLKVALTPRVERLGYLGEFFTCAAHQPAALADFIAFTEHAKAGLSDNIVELIALTSAGVLHNTYERHQHEQLCLKLGLDREWVGAVNALSPEQQERLSMQERRLQRFVLVALSSHGRDASGAFEDIVEEFGDANAVAAIMVLSRYVMHALLVNTFALAPPAPSIFADESAS
jgi:hypothetical protein